MKKIISYLPFIVLLLLPLLFYPVVDTSGWRSSSDVHAFFEFASSLLAVTAGIMVLLHFFTTGRWFFLIISIGLGIVGTEQFVHAIFSFNRIWSEIHPTFKLAVSTTWLTGHFILLASFFLALIFGNKEIFPAKRGLSAVVYNIIGLIFAASATLLIFNSPFLPQFVQLGSITKKLIELFLALLYFVAFLSYSNIYFKQQSHSPLLWGIIAFIIFRVLAHIFVFDAKDFYDAHWDAAHLIVFLSYFFPIIGIWGETIKLHRAAQSQVIELKKEMVERKRAEDALRESRQKLITAQRIAKIGDFTWNLETGDVVWSDAMHDIIGYDKTEKIDYAKVNSEIHHPDDLVRITQWFNDCISSGKKELSQNEYRLIRKDGIIIYVRASVLVEHSEDKPITVFGTIQDITEQKQAEDVIKQNEVRYRYISETISDFAYSCIKIPGGEYAIDWMIGATEHISGYTIDEIKAWGCWKNMVDPVHFPIFEDNILNISPGTSSECELKIIRKDGVTRWLRCLTRCLLSDEDNTIHCLYGGCKDITEHKQIESKLQDSERKFRTLFENSRDAIYITTKEGKFIDFNLAYLELFGYTKEEMATLHAKDTYMNPADRNMFKKTIERKGSVRDYEVKLRRKDGRQMDCIVAAATRHADDGSISGYQGIIRDITERKRLEEQLHTMSLTDDLTGLYNRRGFFTLAQQQMKVAERTKKDMLLFFVDLDKMKHINDTLGHKEGDKALIEIATILKEVFRESDIIGRMGGDEFAILAIDTTDETREVLIHRLHNIIDDYNRPEGRNYQLSLSIGVAHYNPETPSTLDELMAQADTLMYEEKRGK